MSRVRELNDALRTTFEGGRVLITAGVGALSPILACEALQKVRTFNDFTPDNDPYGEHDFGGFELAGRKFLWKIDYYDKSMTLGAADPADPEQTKRVACGRLLTHKTASFGTRSFLFHKIVSSPSELIHTARH
jgi:Protein of unknown function (DUF3768)